MVTYTSLTPGSIATLICDPGYTVGNEQNRTCLSDGHWSDETLECVEVPPTGTCACTVQSNNLIFVEYTLPAYCIHSFSSGL